MNKGTKVYVTADENKNRPTDHQVDLSIEWIVTDTDGERAIIKPAADTTLSGWVVSVENLIEAVTS